MSFLVGSPLISKAGVIYEEEAVRLYFDENDELEENGQKLNSKFLICKVFTQFLMKNDAYFNLENDFKKLTLDNLELLKISVISNSVIEEDK